MQIPQEQRHPVCVATFYHFVHFPDYATLREPLLQHMLHDKVKGTILLAAEGINGTISGTDAGVSKVLRWLTARAELAGLNIKYSRATEQPFYRSKVKLKKEIVTMGVATLDFCPGMYVSPVEWNALIQRDDLLLVDTRNDYEYAIGTFAGAINPQLTNFRSFPGYLQSTIKERMAKHKLTKLAMFCTGGIRCEKASSLARVMGVEEVYQLKGGILAYLQQVPQEESLWRGECFVFDNRVAVGHGLQQGSYSQCFACRYPITEEDKCSPYYVPGEACPRCYGKRSHRQRMRAAERAKQLRIARHRKEDHIAVDLEQMRRQKAVTLASRSSK